MTQPGLATVMGPGELTSSAGLVPPCYNKSTDKLQWRKSIRYWCQGVTACANGGDSRAKGISASLALTLFRSLPPGKQQLVEKNINSGELVIDPNDPAAPADQTEAVEKIILIVAKDSPTDAIRRMAALNKQVSGCQRRDSEKFDAYIERFTHPAQAYLNITNSDQSSAESQNFAMMLISNAKLPPSTFTSVMNNLVQSCKMKSQDTESYVPISVSRLAEVISLLKCVSVPEGDQKMESSLTGTLSVLEAAKRRVSSQISDCALSSYISLSDAIAALEESSIGVDDLKGGGQTENAKSDSFSGAAEKMTQALLAHTAMAKKFNNTIDENRQQGGYQRDDRRHNSARGNNNRWNRQSTNRTGASNGNQDELLGDYDRPRKFQRRPADESQANDRQDGAGRKGRFFQ